MQFKGDKAIYLQIADYIMENILSGKWKEQDRIPSVRDMAVSIEVNPNTVVNAYTYMQDKGVIFNQRGVGYFVAPQARDKARQLEKENFYTEQLPKIFKNMILLGVGIDDIRAKFDEYKKNAKVQDKDK